MRRTVIALLICALMAVVPISAFAAAAPNQASEQSSSAQSMVELKNMPVVVDGVRYAQGDPHVKNATQFVFDDAAKAEGVVYGFTSQDLLMDHLQKATASRQNENKDNTVSTQAVYYSSYFYEHSNYGGNSFGRSSNLSYVGSYWNDRISSLKAGSNHNWTVLCWDINYGGSRFWVQAGINVSYVGSTWNDKASSIFFTN